MSTRSCIARKTKAGFNGRYHHWDGYPSGLGAYLYKLYHGHFKRNLDRMLEVLIDEHPAGFSTICDKNFKKTPKYTENVYRDRNDPLYDTNPIIDDRPICFCHGDRHESGWECTHQNAADSGCEYAYSFAMETREKEKGRKEPVMNVLSSYSLNGNKMIGYFGMGDDKSFWVPIGKVFLNDFEPNWKTMEDNGRKNLSLENIIVEFLKNKGIIFPNFKKEKKHD